MTAETKLTVTLHLHAPLLAPGRKEPITQPGPNGEPGEYTLGEALLRLLLEITPAKEPRAVLLRGRVLDRLAEADETESGEYVAGEAALRVLREAAKENRPAFRDLIMAQVWAALGTGENEGDEEEV